MIEKLENKLKWDWQEMIPGVGIFKCLAVNFDNANERNYVGLGGQFKKHCEQARDLGLIPSIPNNMILYGFYQTSALAGSLLIF